MPNAFALAQQSAAQASAWLMYHIVNATGYSAVLGKWLEKDGEKGLIDDVAGAGVLARNLFDAIPCLDDDIDIYEFYPEYADRVLAEMGNVDPFLPDFPRAVCRAMAALHEADKYIDWEIEGTGLTFDSAWAAAPYFQQGRTLLCRAIGDPAVGSATRTLLRVNWIDGKLPLWMIGALQYLSQYQATRPVWHSAEGATHCLSEMTAPDYGGSPLILLHQGRPYDNLKQEGVMAYLADEIWEVL